MSHAIFGILQSTLVREHRQGGCPGSAEQSGKLHRSLRAVSWDAQILHGVSHAGIALELGSPQLSVWARAHQRLDNAHIIANRRHRQTLIMLALCTAFPFDVPNVVKISSTSSSPALRRAARFRVPKGTQVAQHDCNTCGCGRPSSSGAIPEDADRLQSRAASRILGGAAVGRVARGFRDLR